MPTTSNFGWTTPADTDYVKDGALAIRTLANGIDTSLVDLKGGTTGQILSKNSNTDLDYTWINNDQGDITNVAVTSPITGGGSSGSVTIGIDDGTTTQKGAVQLEDSTSSTSTTKAATPNSVKSAYDLANGAIPKSLIDAEGDLIVGDAADAVQRLGIGSNGNVLTVDTSVDGKIKWAAPAGGSDLVRITTQTFSAQTGVIFTDCFSSTYHNYLILGSVVQSQSASTILRLRNSGGDYTTADQRAMLVYGDFTNNTVLTDGATNRDFVFSFSPGTTRLNFYYWLFSPELTEVTQGFGGRVNATIAGSHYYFANNSNSYPSLNLTVSAGTFSGEMSIYGYKRS